MVSKSFLWIIIGGVLYWGGLYCVGLYFKTPPQERLPQLAIANFARTPVLDAAIRGMKDGLLKKGYEHGKNLRIFEEDARGEQERIEPMLAHLSVRKVKAFVTLTKPVFELSKVRLKKTHVIALYKDHQEKDLAQGPQALLASYDLGLKTAEQIVVQIEKKEKR